MAILVLLLSLFCVSLFGQTGEKDWQNKAIQKYPELGVKGSEFNSRFLNAYADRRKTDPNFFASPQWPLILADELATPPPVAAPKEIPTEVEQPTESASPSASLPFGIPPIAFVGLVLLVVWVLISKVTKAAKRSNLLRENIRLYFCRDGQTTEGPLPADQLFRMNARGEIDKLALVRPDGTDEWESFGDFWDRHPEAFSKEVHAAHDNAVATIKAATFMLWCYSIAAVALPILIFIYFKTLPK